MWARSEASCVEAHWGVLCLHPVRRPMWRPSEASYVEAHWSVLCGGPLRRPIWRPIEASYVEAHWDVLCGGPLRRLIHRTRLKVLQKVDVTYGSSYHSYPKCCKKNTKRKHTTSCQNGGNLAGQRGGVRLLMNKCVPVRKRVGSLCKLHGITLHLMHFERFGRFF